MSRTFLRDDIIGPDDFHGAVYYGELIDSDLSYEFIDAIEQCFVIDNSLGNDPEEDCPMQNLPDEKMVDDRGIDEVRALADVFGVQDINLIKPGIGETTRVLLRRVPWKILIDNNDRDNPELSHIIRLAEEKNVPIEYYPLKHYKCCGMIRKLAEA